MAGPRRAVLDGAQPGGQPGRARRGPETSDYLAGGRGACHAAQVTCCQGKA